jgi:hypothetical protein
VTGGQRPFLGWADELEEFRKAFDDLDLKIQRQPSPELEARMRALLEDGTVHHRGEPFPVRFATTTPAASSRLFDDARMDAVVRARETRAVIENAVARYAADHPDIVQ